MPLCQQIQSPGLFIVSYLKHVIRVLLFCQHTYIVSEILIFTAQ